MTYKPEDRCGYVFPEGFDDNNSGAIYQQNCCYRRTWKDYDRCVWHAEADETKSMDDLRRCRETKKNMSLNGRPAELLDGAYLESANLGSIDSLEKCFLRRANLRDLYYSEASLDQATLSNSDLTDAWLRGTSLNNTSLHQTKLVDTSFQEANLASANLKGAVLLRTDFSGANLADIEPYHASFSEVHIDGETNLLSSVQDEDGGWIRSPKPLCAYDPKKESKSVRERLCAIFLVNSNSLKEGNEEEIKAGDDFDYSLKKAAYTYRLLEKTARFNSMAKLERQLFIRRQDIQRKLLRKEGHPFQWATACLSKSVFTYGEGLWKVSLLSLGTIGTWALAYPWPSVGGVHYSATNTTYVIRDGIWSASPETFLKTIYFSIITFSTVGYGDMYPVGTVAQILAAVESVLGAALLALLIFVLGQRTRR